MGSAYDPPQNEKAESGPDILQDDFAHSHWQLQTIQDKQILFLFFQRENCWRREKGPAVHTDEKNVPRLEHKNLLHLQVRSVPAAPLQRRRRESLIHPADFTHAALRLFLFPPSLHWSC